MSQQKRSLGRTLKLLAKRYGVLSSPVMVIVCAAVMLGVVVLAVGHGSLAQGGLVIERHEHEPANTTQADVEVPANGTSTGTEQEELCVVVHVDGAVEHPGVYQVTSPHPRIVDAVTLAGGLSGDANTDSVNLAAELADGTKVHIPHEGEEAASEAAATPEVASTQVGTVSATSAGGANGLVNINTANADELKTLTGVGDATAAAIIEDREQNGPFAAPEDLMRVSGIGEKKFAKLQGSICV